MQVDNKEGTLLPGMYVITHFTIHRDHPPLLVPADAVLASSQGVPVAVLSWIRTRFTSRRSRPGRNYGDEIADPQRTEGRGDDRREPDGRVG